MASSVHGLQGHSYPKHFPPSLKAGFPVFSDSVHLERMARGADLAADLAHKAARCHVLRLHVGCQQRKAHLRVVFES